jgi:hypothetical protein
MVHVVYEKEYVHDVLIYFNNYNEKWRADLVRLQNALDLIQLHDHSTYLLFKKNISKLWLLPVGDDRYHIAGRFWATHMDYGDDIGESEVVAYFATRMVYQAHRLNLILDQGVVDSDYISVFCEDKKQKFLSKIKADAES